MCAYIVVFVDTIGPRPKCDEIEALHNRLRDKLTESKANGSIEELGVRPDKGIER